jgi:membrane protease YdiL (CAAX protease family)
VLYIGTEFLWPQWLETETAVLSDAIIFLSLYLLLAFLLWLVSLKVGIVRQFSLGERPTRRQTWTYVFLAVPLMGFALFGLYVLYLPLSYVYPEYVAWWLLEEQPLIWWRSDPEAVLANGINGFILLVFGPVLEEVIFRGFLLNRWWNKYGLWRGIIFSSLAFGILHTDPIGSVVFAVVLSLIYVKTKSLIGPFIVHMTNNGLVLLMLLVEGAVFGSLEPQTLDQFQSYWWLAPVGAAVSIPWLMWFAKRLYRPGPI